MKTPKATDCSREKELLLKPEKEKYSTFYDIKLHKQVKHLQEITTHFGEDFHIDSKLISRGE